MDELEQIIRDVGLDLKKTAREVADYTRARAAHLRTLAGDPEIRQAIAAERDAVLLFGAGRVVTLADAADTRMYAVVDTALRILGTAAAAAS